MSREQPDRGQRHRAVCEQIDDAWEATRGTRRLDTPVCGVLREVEHLRAIREERRATFTEVQPARVQFDQRCDHTGRRAPLVASQPVKLGDQITIGKDIQR